MSTTSTLIYAVSMAAVAVSAASAVLETGDKRMDLVGATIVGLVTSLGGGTLRDILVNEVPLVMRPGTLYVTASWLGALVLAGAFHLGVNEAISAMAGGLLVLILRLLAIRFQLSLPTYKSRH